MQRDGERVVTVSVAAAALCRIVPYCAGAMHRGSGNVRCGERRGGGRGHEDEQEQK